MNNKELLYDEIIKVSITNLYTLSKENKKVNLTNFNKKDKSHLCLLVISGYMKMFGCTLSVRTNFLNKFFIKRKTGIEFNITKDKEGIFCDEFIYHIEKAYDRPGIFEEIYDNYFGKEG